jgi:nitrilase
MSSKFKAAVVQATPVLFDVDRTLERVRALTAEAAGRGAALVVFPEAFVGGYPKGSRFGAHVGGRSVEGREEFRRYWESAIEVPGRATSFLGEVARENAVFLTIGVVEREGGTLYCCVLFFAPDGQLLGKHRKLMPTGAERLIWGFGDGSTMPVFETPLGRLGAVICWENYMPMMREAMYAKGIELYCAPTLDGRDSWIASMRHIAVEGRCFVLSCNQFARRGDYPADHDCVVADKPEEIVSRGGSCIVDPFGELLAGPHFDEEAILVADIDRGAIGRGKYDLDSVGHYARPDIFHLIVDERMKRPVTRLHDSATRVEGVGEGEG